jgi:hypothetical protein
MLPFLISRQLSQACVMSRTACGTIAAAILILFSAQLVGCSRGPTAIHQPEFDPATASQQAITQYDTNQDGVLSEPELKACPGILLNRSIYDTDGDGKVSRQEIEERLRNLRLSGVGLSTLNVEVRFNGRPLSGAEVKLVPETYLGDEVKPAWGKTGRRGLAVMGVRDADLPAAEKGATGVHYGTYRVEITHPQVALPPKYNIKSTLGYETQRGSSDYKVELSSR